MCLPDFKEFKQIDESSPIIGYRAWRNEIKNSSLILKSEYQEYSWSKFEGPHEVKDKDSGIYAYNNYKNNYNYYNYYYNNYYNNYNYNYFYNYYYYKNNYNLLGVINQYGKVAIHKEGQRSEYATVKTLFTIRESDMNGPEKFTNWIMEFNLHIIKISKKYNCDTTHWQDFKELKEKE